MMPEKLIIELDSLPTSSSTSLIEMISEANGNIELSFTIQDAYTSSSIITLAMSWLLGWYMGEKLAELSESASYSVAEGYQGAACFLFYITKTSHPIADQLTEWAEAFDPDNLEAFAELIAEAEGWLQTRTTGFPAYFPDLEKAFRDDAAEAGLDF